MRVKALIATITLTNGTKVVTRETVHRGFFFNEANFPVAYTKAMDLELLASKSLLFREHPNQSSFKLRTASLDVESLAPAFAFTQATTLSTLALDMAS